MDNKYITVAETAERCGVSKQAVYQRLNKDLKKYVKVIDGKKQLHIEVLQEFSKVVEQPLEQAIDKELNNNSSDLFKLIETLQEQLTVKDEQIAEKDKLIQQFQIESQKQSEHSRQQSDKLINLLEQNNKLQENNQVLLGRQQQVEQITEHAEAVTKSNEEKEEEPVPKKEGFFQKIFG